MTKTEARLALVQRQRRFEWELARDEQRLTASRLVASTTHDLLNFVQIVQLSSLALRRSCDAEGKQFLDDLARSATDVQVPLRALTQLARPELVVGRGPAVGAVVTRVVAELRAAVEVDLQLAVDAATATAMTAEQLEYLVIGLALDAAAAPRIELCVRDRTIDGKPWVEIMRGTEASEATPDHAGFELRGVELLATTGGGELARSERRGGGTELVVALPALIGS